MLAHFAILNAAIMTHAEPLGLNSIYFFILSPCLRALHFEYCQNIAVMSVIKGAAVFVLI